MRWLWLIAIRSYWRVVPTTARRPCLFRCSCSHYVHEAAARHGFVAGCKAFVLRTRQCRPGYRLYRDPVNREWRMLVADGCIVQEPFINAELILEASGAIDQQQSRAVPVNSSTPRPGASKLSRKRPVGMARNFVA